MNENSVSEVMYNTTEDHPSIQSSVYNVSVHQTAVIKTTTCYRWQVREPRKFTASLLQKNGG